MISLNADVQSEIASTTDDTAPDEQSDNQVKQSRACSIIIIQFRRKSSWKTITSTT